MVNDIKKNIDIINQSIEWGQKYNKDAFTFEKFKDYRRQLRKVEGTFSEKCSIAAYGESQVGKSYLISSLLSTSSVPFVIENKGRKYSFIDEINPSGGNNTKIESTGVITRFTINKNNAKMVDYIKVTNLSVVDIILLLVDAYYNDVKISSTSVLLKDEIEKKLSSLSSLWESQKQVQNIISEDDIKDICEYINDIIGHKAVNINKSNFCRTISPIIGCIADEDWVKVFSLLWNENPEFSKLFSLLISEYKKLNYTTEVYVPFEAVIRNKGTLLRIDWLDSVCGKNTISNDEILDVDVYDSDGNIIADKFSKAYLCALIAELTFVLPEEIKKNRKFLEKLDLLDFPGARSREEIEEQEIGKNLPIILRRGKVSYLFNKYSRAWKISSVLFCHHNDQKAEATLSSSIHHWIEENIGRTPETRAVMLNATQGISPLFMVCTKFNLDLRKTKLDLPETKDKLDAHWARFNITIPNLINHGKWFEDWVKPGGFLTSRYFRNVYLLRDFYWSCENMVFDGYNEKLNTDEVAVHEHADYPGYFDDLKESFLANSFVQKHFENAEVAWNSVATINNDGSKSIIHDLNAISEVLHGARKEKYGKILHEIRDEIKRGLNVYYESDSKEENNIKLRSVVGDIKLRTEFAFGEKPERFGKIIDSLMVSPANIRNIAFDIIIRHKEEPKMVSSIHMIRALCDINVNDERSINIAKLTNRYNKDEKELSAFFLEMGITIEDIISDDSELLATVPDVIVKRIIEYWNSHISEQVKKMSEVLPHSEEISFMIITLLNKLGVRKIMAEKIAYYYNLFDAVTVSNAIADYASLTLNNFVSSVGREYMTGEDISNIAKKAAICHIEIDTSNDFACTEVKTKPVVEVLTALDKSGVSINNARIDLTILRKLPFWDSYQRWENALTIGLVYASDLTHVDPVANAEIKSMIDSTELLYNSKNV